MMAWSCPLCRWNHRVSRGPNRKRNNLWRRFLRELQRLMLMFRRPPRPRITRRLLRRVDRIRVRPLQIQRIQVRRIRVHPLQIQRIQVRRIRVHPLQIQRIQVRRILRGRRSTAEGSPTSPSKVAGLNPNAQQPSYPSTSFGPEVASSGTKGISSMDTYPLNQPGKQVASTSPTEFDSTPPSNSLGPRYNTSVGSFSGSPSPATNRVVPPQSAGPATVAPASQGPLGPRYASLPDNNGPRFDARPAPPAVGGTNVSRPQPPNGGSTPPRYPQSRAPSTAPAYPATTPTQTPTNPFQPGSTTRYVPEPPPARLGGAIPIATPSTVQPTTDRSALTLRGTRTGQNVEVLARET